MFLKEHLMFDMSVKFNMFFQIYLNANVSQRLEYIHFFQHGPYGDIFITISHVSAQ